MTQQQPIPVDLTTDQGKVLQAWQTPAGKIFFGTAGLDAARKVMGMRMKRHLRSKKPVVAIDPYAEVT